MCADQHFLRCKIRRKFKVNDVPTPGARGFRVLQLKEVQINDTLRLQHVPACGLRAVAPQKTVFVLPCPLPAHGYPGNIQTSTGPARHLNPLNGCGI
jgi:hypothetical protein